MNKKSITIIALCMAIIFSGYSMLFHRGNFLGPVYELSCIWNGGSYHSQGMSPEKYCHMPRYLSLEAQTKSGTIFSDDHGTIRIPRGSKVSARLTKQPGTTSWRLVPQTEAMIISPSINIKLFWIDWGDGQSSGPCSPTDECEDVRSHIYSTPGRYEVSADYNQAHVDGGSWYYEGIVHVD